MEIKFGDIIKDNQSKVEGVVYRMYDDGSVTADTAFGSYGYNSINVAHNHSKQNKDLIITNKKDIELAIRMQCYYAIKDMEEIVKLNKDGEISTNEMNRLLVKNHLFNIKYTI